ncbi:hypothetical protein ACOBV8_04065 [Pseudoalteromonas espejiana]
MQFIYSTLVCLFSFVLSINAHAAQPTKKAHPTVDIANKANFEDAEFSLKINDLVMPYSVFSVFVMPQESVEFEVLYAQSEQSYILNNNDGKATLTNTNRWQWQAPKSQD